jgi:hypothetical protein
VRTGLEGVAVNLVEGNFAGLSAFGLGGGSGGDLNSRQKRIQSLAQGAAFWVDGGGGHV